VERPNILQLVTYWKYKSENHRIPTPTINEISVSFDSLQLIVYIFRRHIGVLFNNVDTCGPLADSWFHCQCTRMWRRGRQATRSASRRRWRRQSGQLGGQACRRRRAMKDWGKARAAIVVQSTDGRRSWARQQQWTVQRGEDDDIVDVGTQSSRSSTHTAPATAGNTSVALARDTHILESCSNMSWQSSAVTRFHVVSK